MTLYFSSKFLFKSILYIFIHKITKPQKFNKEKTVDLTICDLLAYYKFLEDAFLRFSVIFKQS